MQVKGGMLILDEFFGKHISYFVCTFVCNHQMSVNKGYTLRIKTLTILKPNFHERRPMFMSPNTNIVAEEKKQVEV